MKILQVNSVYGHKSTGKLTQALHHGLLELGVESLVAFGRGPGSKDPGVYRLCPDWYGKMQNLCSRITGIPYGGCLVSTNRLLRLIRREKPDVVHLQCINGYFVNIYRLIRWLKKHRVKTVVSLHAEFMYTANCGHAFDCLQWQHGCKHCPDKRRANKSLFFDRTGRSWQRMKDAFAGFEKDCVICPVSPWTQQRAQQSDILKDFSFQTVYNGLDTRVFHRNDHTQPRENTVLHVTAHFADVPGHPKGGDQVIRLARKMPEVTFRVAGHSEPVADKPDNVEFLGIIGDQKELARLYREAAVFLLTSQRETFSMPCAESLCCGTPVVGYKAGAPEQIALPRYSEFVEYGDLDELEAALRRWLDRQDLDRQQIAREGSRAYSHKTMVQAFLDIYRRLL